MVRPSGGNCRGKCPCWLSVYLPIEWAVEFWDVTFWLRTSLFPAREPLGCHPAPMDATKVATALETVARVGAITAQDDSPEARAAQVLEELGRLIPFDAAELCTVDPITGSSQLLASTGYTDDVLDALHSDRFHEIMTSLALPDTGRPVRMKDLPGDPFDNWAVSDVLLPAGFSEGLTMCLRTPDGRFTGVLNLSTTSTEHPSDIARDAVAHLCSALGSLADTSQASRWLAMLLGSGSMAVGLDVEGMAVSLPGIASHPLLSQDGDLLRVARRSSDLGSWDSFMWPDEDDWFRVRVVPCQGDQPLSSVVSLDSVDIGPLSRRELEVLTLADDGLSNAEIGEALIIGSRTVATHVEHILDKLSVPNRAAAVATALRASLVLGRVERYDGRRP